MNNTGLVCAPGKRIPVKDLISYVNNIKGQKGDGWYDIRYDAADGTITFYSNDGLSYKTGDVRGRSLTIEGGDTVSNILLKPSAEGNIWIAMDSGVDSKGNNVDVGDGLVSHNGSWDVIGRITGPKGTDGKDGQSVVIMGSDTISNIRTRTPIDGEIWISTDTGIDDNGFQVEKGDGVIARKGSWLFLASLTGPKGEPGQDSSTPGPQGPHGADGIQGVQGPIGPQGTGLLVKGTANTENLLPNTGNTDGDAYIVLDNKSIYGWTDADKKWINLGHFRGPEGPRGIQGVRGPQGPIGVTGANGAKGQRGADGRSGSQGIQGIQGIQGKQGPRGNRGNASTIAGPAGPAGIDGQNGHDGAVGPKGDKGDIGLRGPRGDQGNNGIDGQDGTGVRVRGFDTRANILLKDDAAGDMWIIDNPGQPDHGHGMVSNGHKSWKDVGPLQGPRGSTGPRGADGAVGSSGSVGPRGADGQNGSQGIQGPRGHQGDKGDIGLTGQDGPQGPKGDKGDQGSLGPVGPEGQRGVDGHTGLVGATGPQGDAGPAGSVGPRGDKGDDGTEGKDLYTLWIDAGNVGNFDAMLNALKGSKGDRGAAGPQGPHGQDGHEGQQGPKGNPGPQGQKGSDGNGIKILSAVYDVPDLPKSGNKYGDAHLVTKTGDLAIWSTDDSWHMVGHIRGPKGEKGLQGPQGPQGIQGTVGPHGQNGTQGPSGNDGQPGTKGQKGDTGPQGQAGPKGDKGNDGATGPQGPIGPKGDAGKAGAAGAKGDAGTGVTIKGFASAADILTKTGTAGDMWLISDVGPKHGHGMVSDGAGTGASHWKDVGAIQGPAGSTGAQGQTGPQGGVGPKGDKGIQGVDGPQGIQGPKGDRGAIGHDGPKGPQGTPGTNGVIGHQGPSGPQGSQGIQGHKGDKGDIGPKGDKGDLGNGLDIKSMKDNIAAIRAISKPEVGDIHLAKDTGNMWIWENPTPPHDALNADWHEIGHMRGPRGLPGATGQKGLDGTRGPAGQNGHDGHSMTLKGRKTEADVLALTNPDIGDIYILTDISTTGYHKGDALLYKGKTANPKWQNVGPFKGDKGDTGPQGVSGHNGQDGAPGVQGAKGLKGDTGHEGPQGPQGPTGPKGADGVRGTDGKNGAGVSIKGTDTEANIKLKTGTDGDMWIISGGANDGHGLVWIGGTIKWKDVGSIKGPKGPTGSKGGRGAIGPKGDAGISWHLAGRDTEAVIKTKTGKPGDMWIIAEPGHAKDGHALGWDPMLKPKAGWRDMGQFKGDKGDTGTQGPQGPRGPAGNDGHQGIQGVKGDTGLKGAQGHKGDKGLKGDKGDTGHTGPRGDEGHGLHILSIKDNHAAIAAIPSPSIGDIHLAKDTGNMWIFDNPTPPHDASGATWNEIGHVRGPKGATGPQGAVGHKGDKGDTGPKGDTGTKGHDGANGHDGAAGAPGTQGPAGIQGLKGDKGDTGPQGPKGKTGAQGIPGVAGHDGPQGGVGPKGATGNTGKAGTGVVIRGTDTLTNIHKKTGAAGNMWIDSATGHGHISDGKGAGAAHWKDVGAIQGPKGDKGDTGAKGSTGVAGPKGPIGPKGSTGHIGLTGSKGVQGNPGPTGGQGPKGDQGIQGVAGATGGRGATGARGAKGAKGDTGTGLHFQHTYKDKAALIADNPHPSIGDIHLTVDTGNLWVFDSPTPPHDPANAVWSDVGHVQGPEGKKGDVGPAGPHGNAGTPGIKGPKGDEGAKGLKGDTGAQGHTGPAGNPGPKGDKGDQGLQGNPGARGPAGNPGVDGTDGKPGPIGPRGPKGDTRIKAMVQTKTDLDALTANEIFDLRHVYDECQDYVFNGTDWEAAGNFVGSVGPQGPRGDAAEYATQDEVDAGILASKAVSPLTFKAYTDAELAKKADKDSLLPMVRIPAGDATSAYVFLGTVISNTPYDRSYLQGNYAGSLGSFSFMITASTDAVAGKGAYNVTIIKTNGIPLYASDFKINAYASGSAVAISLYTKKIAFHYGQINYTMKYSRSQKSIFALGGTLKTDDHNLNNAITVKILPFNISKECVLHGGFKNHPGYTKPLVVRNGNQCTFQCMVDASKGMGGHPITTLAPEFRPKATVAVIGIFNRSTFVRININASGSVEFDADKKITNTAGWLSVSATYII